MGVVASNVGSGRDYATNEYYFEFHRRLIIPKAAFEQVQQLLDAGQFDQAKQALKGVAVANSHPAIDLFIDELKQKAAGRTP